MNWYVSHFVLPAMSLFVFLSSHSVQGPSDIPLLSHIIRIATKLLLATLSDTETEQGALTAKDVNVGFVNGLPRE